MAVKHLKDVTIIKSNIRAHISMDRINKNLDRAQYALDSQIMTDMVPYMPFNTGTFVNNTRARSAALAGTGVVCAAAPPMGRYLYFGKVMVDAETGKGPMNIPGVGPRYKPGAKLRPIERPLNYSNPRAQSEWFEVAKEKNLKNWVKIVERELKK